MWGHFLYTWIGRVKYTNIIWCIHIYNTTQRNIIFLVPTCYVLIRYLPALNTSIKFDIYYSHINNMSHDKCISIFFICTGMNWKWNNNNYISYFIRHLSKYWLPMYPPLMVRWTFCSNKRRLHLRTSAASLFRGSSGLGSKNKNCKP